MKARYIVALAIIILAMILFEYLMLAHPIGDSSKLGNAIQAAAVFIAPLAAVAAIAASDSKPKQVNRVNLDLWYPVPATKGGHSHGALTVHRHPDPADSGSRCDPPHVGGVSAGSPAR